MRRHAESVAVVFALLIGACGDPIAPNDYTGRARLHLEGIVCGSEGPLDAMQPTLGIFWKWFDAGESRWELSNVTTLEADALPTYFSTDLYDLPPVSASNTFESDQGSMTADVGCPVLFDDENGDGAYDGSEPILAVAWDQLLVYVRGDVESARASELPLVFESDIAPGYRLVEGACQEGTSDRVKAVEPGGLVNLTSLDRSGSAPEAPAETCIHFF